MATPDELAQYREAALRELTLGIGRLSSHELDMVNSMQVAGLVENYRGRLRALEELESSANYERHADAERAAAYRAQVYGGGSGAQGGPQRDAGGQFTGEEQRVQALMREMAERGMNRL
jgi:hypothetical protein